MLIDQFQRVFYETTVKPNSLLKIIHIHFKLVVQKYERGCMHSHKKHSHDLKFDGEFVIKH